MKKKNITIIGRTRTTKTTIADGGCLKVNLYAKKLSQEGFNVNLVDLFNWKYHALKLIFSIKRCVKTSDIILIMGGPNGSRLLIKLVNKLNKKLHKRVGFCPLGIGTLDHLLKGCDGKTVNDFLNCKDFNGFKDEKMGNDLKKLEFIIPQNELLCNVYKNFYGLDNVYLVNNFRDTSGFLTEKTIQDKMHLLYFSRVAENKGIFDLLQVIYEINLETNNSLVLDVFGESQLSENEIDKFNLMTKSNEINYKGVLKNEEVGNLLGNYDILVFPTRYYGEGTPGTVIEALLNGLPVLISDYSQARLIINNNENGWIYNFNDLDDLKAKLIFLLNNKNIVLKARAKAFESSKKYTYDYNRKNFLQVVTGEQINE